MPLISVVIPVYNGEKTIKETIESVLKQTFCDWELIVINDGSRDRTLEIIQSISEPRLKVFTYPNAGLSASRNRGISLARGEYISFLDADDLWTTDKLEAQLQALQNNPKAAVAYSWSSCIDESGNTFRPGGNLTYTGDVYLYLLLINFVENGSNVLIRTQALKEVGNFDETLTSCEDWDMWLRLAAKYEFVAVEKPQILYRISANSMSANLLRMEAESMQVINRKRDRDREDYQHIKRLSKGNFYKYLVFKALDLTPKSERGWIAAKLLWQAVRYDPSLLQTKVIWKVLFRIVAVIILPSQIAERLFIKMKGAAKITTIFSYLRLEP